MKRQFSAFSEKATEIFDFARCQRPDGSTYGIAAGKQCRKGTEIRAEEKRGKELFRAGSKVDLYDVGQKAEEWRKAAGLDAFPGTLDWSHDLVHALVHEFLGGHDKIGEWIGQGPATPTPAEETLVNMVHRAAALKARGENVKEILTDAELKRYFIRDIKFLQGRNNIKDEHLSLYLKPDGEPDTAKFIEKYREMEATDGFDLLLDASHSAFINAGDYVL